LHRRLVLIAVLVAAFLISAAAAQAFSAKLKASGHHPKAGKPYPIKVIAHRGNGKPMHANSYYHFLFNGTVVKSCAPRPHARNHHKCPTGKPHQFFGSYKDILFFPKAAVGHPLTFQVVVHGRHAGTKKLNYKVTTRK
jgi:hypothetical protein